jgi:hypothetical protein
MRRFDYSYHSQAATSGDFALGKIEKCLPMADFCALAVGLRALSNSRSELPIVSGPI